MTVCRQNQGEVRLKVEGMDVWIVAERCRKDGDQIIFTNCGRSPTPMGKPVSGVNPEWSTSERNLEPVNT